MESNTKRGLYFLIIGLAITTIYAIIVSISLSLIDNTYNSIFFSYIGIISFIGGILILVGAIFFFLGRKEFGEKHHENIKKALIILVVNIIFGIIFVSAISFFIVSTMFSSIGAESSVESDISLPLSLFVIIMIISAILGALIYYFGLIELEDERGKTILYAGMISSIIISVITSMYVVGLLGEFLGSFDLNNSSSMINFTQNIGGIGILGIIPNVLFLYAFYIPYNRIKTGELIPQITSKDTSIESSPIINRYCGYCGRNIPLDSLICPYCGKKLEVKQR
jgi:Na+-driven multidrug efflux pump